MEKIGFVFLGALITFVITYITKFLDNKKKDNENKQELIDKICNNLFFYKKEIDRYFERWIEYHFYQSSYKHTNEQLIENLLLINKEGFEKVVIRLEELEANFYKFRFEYLLFFSNDELLRTELKKIIELDLTISNEEFNKVKTKKNLDIAHKNYISFSKNKMENEINPLIDNLIVELRNKQKKLRKNLNFFVKNW